MPAKCRHGRICYYSVAKVAIIALIAILAISKNRQSTLWRSWPMRSFLVCM